MNKKTSKNELQRPWLSSGLDFLELIAAKDTPLTMPMLARELRWSKNKIIGIASLLESRGYIHKIEGTDTFVISNRLFEFGVQNPLFNHLIRVAAPLMQALSEKVDQSCHIAVASRNQIVVVFNVEAQGYLSFAVRIGHRQALLRSASGRTMLAFQAPEVAEQWLQFEPEDAAREKLRKHAENIRIRGFEKSDSEMVAGIVDIAVPIFDNRSSGAIAGLVMPLVTRLTDSKEHAVLIEAVRTTAADISRSLGADNDTIPE